jgi:hypothetical protein
MELNCVDALLIRIAIRPTVETPRMLSVLFISHKPTADIKKKTEKNKQRLVQSQ